MSELHRFTEDKLPEFFTLIDWSYVKRAEVTKTIDGMIWVKLIHYRSGKYMQHGLKHGFKSEVK
jgi:hypothetical protein